MEVVDFLMREEGDNSSLNVLVEYGCYSTSTQVVIARPVGEVPDSTSVLSLSCVSVGRDRLEKNSCVNKNE